MQPFPRPIKHPPLRSMIGLAAALACLSQPVQAQSEGQTVVVTGTRLPLTATGLAQNVTVIDQKEIQEINPARIEDLLAHVTGAYVDQAGMAGGFASLYMRGAENSHLLILLDGVKLNDPTTTRGSAYDLSSIDISQIDRIEVLRGPASAVYGGEALAGVVHIITRRATQTGVSGSAYVAAGGEGHRKLGGAVAFGQDNLRAQISAGRSEEGESGDDNGSVRLNTVSGSLQFAPGGGIEGEVFGTHIDRKGEAFPDDSGGPRLAVNREHSFRDSTDQIYGVKLAGGDARRVLVKGGVSVFDRTEHADNAFVDAGVRFPVPAYVSDTDFRRTNVFVTATHEYSNAASVIVGYEHQNEEGSLTSVGDFFFIGSPQTLTFELDRSTDSVFAEGRFKLTPEVSAQIGLRYDKVEGLGGVSTPHIGLLWDLPNGATTLKASYNEGFKPPSFFALGFPIGGNPDLRPERSKNLEFIAAHRIDNAGSVAQVSVFRTDYTDLVDFDGATFTNINRGTIVIKGIEPEIKLRLAERWRLQFGATLLNIDEQDGLQPLRNRPEQRATAAATYDIDGRSTVFVGLNYTGDFLDRSNPTGDIQMPGFTVVDAAYSIRFGSLRIKLAIDNLFDKDYEQFVGFPALGRRLRAELRGSF
jgi:vitamin B12 transporter